VSTPFRYAYACLSCRKSFKRPGGVGAPDERPCPQCRGPALNLGRHFRAPAIDDDQQWEKVTFLVRHGFRFAALYDPSSGTRIGYPATLREAKDFVRRYGHLVAKRSAVGRHMNGPRVRKQPQNKRMQLTGPATRSPRS
jgi:hypothetical protein